MFLTRNQFQSISLGTTQQQQRHKKIQTFFKPLFWFFGPQNGYFNWKLKIDYFTISILSLYILQMKESKMCACIFRLSVYSWGHRTTVVILMLVQIRQLLVIESELAKNIIHPTQVQTYICEQLHSLVIRLSKTTLHRLRTLNLWGVRNRLHKLTTSADLAISSVCDHTWCWGGAASAVITTMWPCRHPGSRPSIVYMGYYHEKILIYSSKFRVPW